MFLLNSRTDLSTDSGPHPVHCGANRWWFIFFIDHLCSNSISNHVIINVSGFSTCRISSIAIYALVLLLCHTTVGLDYQLIITTCAGNTASFIAIHYYWTRYWLGQFRRHIITELVLSIFVDHSQLFRLYVYVNSDSSISDCKSFVFSVTWSEWYIVTTYCNDVR